jgi:phospholipid N-methyltransferase
MRHTGNGRSVPERRDAVAVRVRALVSERVRFLRSFLASPRRVGAILPTSERTVRAMLDMAPIARAGCVVELGAGTGPHTREILRRIGPQGRLLAFEVDTALARALAAEVTDPRLSVITDSAERLEAHLDGRRPEVVVSALPFTSLPVHLRCAILTAVGAVLADDGALLVLQYSPFLQRELERHFGSVERRLSPLNVPPAVLFACRRRLGAPGRVRAPTGDPAEGAP